MAKAKPERNEEREERILMEIIVDANGSEEQVMGWYYYLDEQLQFPFAATCIVKRSISPLREKDKVEVIGMASADECEREMFVTIRWKKDSLDVPLAQLEPTSADDEQTMQAVEDWHYWVERGYEF